MTIQQLKDRLSKQLDAALEEHVRAAEGWASKVRLVFALVFAASAAWLWNHYSTAKYIYLGLAVAWLVALGLGLAAKQLSDAGVRMMTLLDLTIVHLGLAAFVQQGLFPRVGAGVYLCYFPLLAIAANRYRIALVLQAALYAAVGYAAISLWAGSAPWFRLAMLGVTAYVFVMGSRKPKDLIAHIGLAAAQDAYEQGARQKELELMPQVHQLFLPPPIVDLPALWTASKHSAGTETGGDYFHIFDAPRGPLVVIGDLGGHGFEAVSATAGLHQQLAHIISRETELPRIVAELNAYLWQKYEGRRPFSCALAQWEGEQMRYVNAGHLPLIQMSKPQGAQIVGSQQLPVTAGAVGVQADAAFAEAIVPFPARDQLVLYTDGVFAKLAADRDQGAAEVAALAERFSGAEVTTLCHRIFDCAQPGLEPNKDDSTVVVIRRQMTKGEDAKQAGAAS